MDGPVAIDDEDTSLWSQIQDPAEIAVAAPVNEEQRDRLNGGAKVEARKLFNVAERGHWVYGVTNGIGREDMGCDLEGAEGVGIGRRWEY